MIDIPEEQGGTKPTEYGAGLLPGAALVPVPAHQDTLSVFATLSYFSHQHRTLCQQKFSAVGCLTASELFQGQTHH